MCDYDIRYWTPPPFRQSFFPSLFSSARSSLSAGVEYRLDNDMCDSECDHYLLSVGKISEEEMSTFLQNTLDILCRKFIARTTTWHRVNANKLCTEVFFAVVTPFSLFLARESICPHSAFSGQNVGCLACFCL